jgi:predicted RNA binding protein YcfA (HicA-like mRNA interferase family)
MPKNIPSLKPRELLRMLAAGGCSFHRHGKGDHDIYLRNVEGRKRIAPIDMGAGELSPPYVIRIFRQFGFTDQEIDELLANR